MTYLFSTDLHFDLYKKETPKGDTLFVIGGIHGDEPGAYFAPMILINHYKIKSGSLWIVPNLNFDSIIANKRGIYGDMNRKFQSLSPKDKDYTIVQDIKKLITDKKVDLILNLHDGYGFYRKDYKNQLFNPKAWGQSFVIDQSFMQHHKYGNLEEIAKIVNSRANVYVQEDVHDFNIKNTNTSQSDKDMQLSLTYFAIKNHKPAFAIETSKHIKELSLKVYYHLQTIEKFMDIMNIDYIRNFDLTVNNISNIISDYGTVEFCNSKVKLDLNNIRDNINLTICSDFKPKPSNPLFAMVKNGNIYKTYIGNILISNISIDTENMDNSINDIDLITDDKKRNVKFGSIVDIKDYFLIPKSQNYRVNVIGFGFTKDDTENKIFEKSMIKKFSIDRDGKIYKVEIYRENSFCGSFFVRFK